MRHLDLPVYTVKDLREYINNPSLDENMVVFLSTGPDAAKPLVNIDEEEITLNDAGDNEKAVILDADPPERIRRSLKDG